MENSLDNSLRWNMTATKEKTTQIINASRCPESIEIDIGFSRDNSKAWQRGSIVP